MQWPLWMLRNPVITAFTILVASLTGAFTVSAEDYPTRPVHIVVPTAAGSNSGHHCEAYAALSRAIAQAAGRDRQ